MEERLAKVDIPVHLGVQVGRGWQLDDTLKVFRGLQSTNRLSIRPGPPMQERPFHEFHDEMVRWFDHWLKGVDTGMLEGPPIQIALEGSHEIIDLDEWPPRNVEWTDLYLRPGKRLSREPEHLDHVDAPPHGYYQAPQRVSDQVGSLTYTTDILRSTVV